ncbi:hypothetical protein [Streptomyces naganishii]|uniref:hypothetical protein n=1 Tax=Streptomyces naganishii TaxID=285447 RepID=UPI0027E5AC8F|nr:hypothetical protein [Streptomyces naganishii]
MRLRLRLRMGLCLGFCRDTDRHALRGRRRTSVTACANGPYHHVHAYRGEHQEHHAEQGRDLVVIADREIRDAYAENGPDQDEQGLTDPEGQKTEKETEHPVIPPDHEHVRQSAVAAAVVTGRFGQRLPASAGDRVDRLDMC